MDIQKARQFEQIAEFFDLQKKCPESIPNCEHLRKDYQNRLSIIRANAACDACAESSLRQIFVQNLKILLKVQ